MKFLYIESDKYKTFDVLDVKICGSCLYFIYKSYFSYIFNDSIFKVYHNSKIFNKIYFFN